jgi:hypothetical protein
VRTVVIARTYEEGRARAKELQLATRDRVIVTPTTHPGAIAGMRVAHIDDPKDCWLDLNPRTWQIIRSSRERHGPIEGTDKA